MKTLKISILVLMTTFLACKKDDDNIPSSSRGSVTTASTNSIDGTWKGKYGYGADSTTFYYCFKIKPDGVMEEWSQFNEKIGEGTWNLTGKIFTSAYHNYPANTSSYSVTATFDSTTHKLNGTWGWGTNNSNAGKWFMNKQ